MWRLRAADVDALSLGAAMMGGGGGGSTSVAATLAERTLRETGPLLVVDAAELPAEAWVAALGLVGSVTVFQEKPLAGAEVIRAVRALERYTGRALDAVMGFEAAGVNAPLAVAAAATLGLPLLDADGMGRAFPQLDQTVFTLHGVPVAPLVIADDKESIALLDGVDHFLAERLARSTVVAMGGWALAVFAPQRAAGVAAYAIGGTISKALDVGRRLGRRDLASVFARHGGGALLRGRVVDVARHANGRFGGGTAVLQRLDDRDAITRVEFQNENLLVVEDGEVRASVPDVICLLDAERCAPVTSEDLRYGLELDVVVLPCAPPWRTPAGLGLVGPRAFGYGVAYTVPRVEP